MKKKLDLVMIFLLFLAIMLIGVDTKEERPIHNFENVHYAKLNK